MTEFRIKRNDHAPMVATLIGRDGAPADLTGATVRLILTERTPERPVVVDAAAVVTDPTAGKVTYAWTAADTAAAGAYYGEFEATYADATVQTFPTIGYFTVRVEPDLG